MSVLHRFDGAIVRRTIDPSCAVVAEHAHDWPVLSLYVLGGYRNVTERGEQDIADPSFVFYARGAAHRNTAGDVGFEQIEIEFDPAWLGTAAMPDEAVVMRIGGTSGAIARSLAVACCSKLNDEDLRLSVRRLLRVAHNEFERPLARWIPRVAAALRADPCRRIGDLAREADVSAGWIGPAYRRCTGEGLKQTAARMRVERAAHQLRETDRALADIAMETGFCDQSHMNRTVRRVMGRAPMAIRLERETFRRDH
jgi:AraC family transcriptional regulator